MFVRITGAPVKIRKTQVLKARGVMSVSLSGTSVIYWLQFNFSGRTFYLPVCLQFYFILLFSYYSYTDTINYLRSAVSNGRLTVNNRQRFSLVLPVSSTPAHTTWGYWERERISLPGLLVPSPKFKTITPHPKQNKENLPLDPKLIMDNFITIWNRGIHFYKMNIRYTPCFSNYRFTLGHISLNCCEHRREN
jgi:hypothetical protein